MGGAKEEGMLKTLAAQTDGATWRDTVTSSTGTSSESALLKL